MPGSVAHMNATMKAALRLNTLWAEITDLNTTCALLQWDQETNMPAAGATDRPHVMATMAALLHTKLTNPELRDVIDAVDEGAGEDAVLVAQARQARRHVDRAIKIPEKLAKECAGTTSRSQWSWQQARAEDDFTIFRDDLAAVIALTRQRAAALAGSGNLYDALLDEFEPDATEDKLGKLFATLRHELSPLVKAVSQSGVQVDQSPALGDFPVIDQLVFACEIATKMGFDFDAGRLDRSTHPFCTGLNRGDVRLTWRADEGDFRPALYGVMHEVGHGLYEQRLPAVWQRTPIGTAESLGIHESQSRLWENLVGRNRAFWRWTLPLFRAAFPAQAGFSVDDMWRALHVVAPTLIRVDADEVTYNLHIAVRFEIERRLIAGDLEVDELPAVWDDMYEDLLGIRPRSAADGILQDIHWSMGAFGYFPTYALGNLIASQLYEAAIADLGPLDDAFGQGEFSLLLDWLASKVHCYGSRYLPDELIDRATGRPLSVEPFLTHVRRICADNYGVTV